MVNHNSGGLDLLVIQPTALCNLDCNYCYVPDRLNAQRLSISLLGKLCQTLRSFSALQNQETLKVLWHAGEPLAAGITYFRQALEVIDQDLGERWRIRHSIQTNGTLVNPEWCDLFQEKNIAIGVSLDGPEELHDANRKTLGGAGSFVRVMRGIELLRERNIPVYILAVLNSQNIDCPDKIFQFFVNHGLSHIAFNVEEIEGPNLNSSLLDDSKDFAKARLRYGSFMSRMAKLNRQNGWPLRIREFLSLAQLIEKWREFPTYVPPVPEQRKGAILTLAKDGTMYSWSPELVSGLPGASDRFSLGNICDIVSIDQLLLTERAQAIQQEIDRGVEMCRKQCEYFNVCGGGSPGNKVYEWGTFAVTETLKCALQTQELAEVILSTFSVNKQTRQEA